MDSFKVNRMSYAEMQRLVSKWAEEGIHTNEEVSIEISEDGYWVINGVKTEHKAVTEVPVKSVNGKTGDVRLKAADVGADAAGTAAAEVSALQNTFEFKLSSHNEDETAHSDIRDVVTELKSVIDKFFSSEADNDENLDRLVEIVNIINSNKESIDAILTNKVNVTDIVNDLNTNVANKPLSAAKGVYLKALIDALSTSKLDASALTDAINTALAQAKASGAFDGKDGFSVFYVSQHVNLPPDADANATIDVDRAVIITNGRTIQHGDFLLWGSCLYRIDTETEISTVTVRCHFLVDLKGLRGVDGKTPVKGVDYFTEADKTEMITAVLEAIGCPLFGVPDENKNILLSGNLADGTYTLKWKNEDGTYTDIGTLDVGTIVKVVNLFEKYTYRLNERYSASNTAWKAQPGSVGFELPMADIVGKTMRFSGFGQIYGTGSTSNISWYACDESNALKQTFSNIFTSDILTDEGNNTYSWVVPSVSGTTKLMVFLPIYPNTSITEVDFTKVSWTITD